MKCIVSHTPIYHKVLTVYATSNMRKMLYIIPILSIFIIYGFFNSYSHSFSSNNNNYSFPDATLYDKNTCFSPNDKLVDTNSNNWTHVFENAKESVVKVAVSNSYGNPEISTGFIYDNDGHIVTNYHVVNNANLINVTFADGNSYPAQISGTDPYSDLAVLQASAALKKEQMKPLPIRNSTALQIGENVGAIGYPFEQLSYSVGNIKKINILRENIFGYVQTGMIQHDACGYHGSSGGPLLDLQGQLLGVNSYPGLQGYDVPGLTLAIPSKTIQKIVPKLISQHSYEHPWLGVDVTDLTPDNNSVVNHYGAVVEDVDPGSPAAKIGIEGLEPNLSSISDPFIVHDIITAINGSPIKNSSNFYNYIHNKSVGDTVVLTTMHDGVTYNFTVTLGEMPSPL
jgi:S1-C subfamily serine protease